MPPQRCGLIPRTLQREGRAQIASCGIFHNLAGAESDRHSKEEIWRSKAAVQRHVVSLWLQKVTLPPPPPPPRPGRCSDLCHPAGKNTRFSSKAASKKKIALGLCMHKHAEILARHCCHYHSAKVSSPSFFLSSSSFHIQFHTTVYGRPLSNLNQINRPSILNLESSCSLTQTHLEETPLNI